VADNYEQYSKDELLRLLRERDRKPRFGLVWERDEIEHDKSLNDDFVALDLDADLSCGDAPFENLIIEGDNFDALRYLRMTHAGQVKCIYIDPPYNTGNRDFIYNDRFVDKDDTYRHSKWLEFMYRRLVLAKDLLAEDGVIFVSIGEDEFFRLASLMDQIFVGMPRVGTFIWKTRHSADSRNQTGCSIDHEYVFCYGQKIRGTFIDETKFSNPDNDHRGAWRSADMTGLATKEQRPNLHYDLTNPESGSVYSCPPKGWRYEPKSMRKLLAEHRVLWPADPSGRPRLKKFLGELTTNFKGFSSLLDVPLTSDGTKELNSVDLGQGFPFPKPTGMIQALIEQATQPGDLVLDFFAGSGTTAHAVMKLNAEDGGKRRFILVSSTEATGDAPDKNLCRDVCAERVRRVAQGYTNKNGEAVDGLGGGFAYLRTKRIPISRVFNDIQHEQVWRALQLIHRTPLSAYDEGVLVQLAGDGDDRLVYAPKLSEAVLDELSRLAELGGRLVVYSWQPGQIRQRVEAANVAFERIPEFLVSRFGGMAR
jgi:adenine-specific DNA-methyltransferase